MRRNTSTFLTLLIMPTFYETLADWRDWLARKLLKRPARVYAPPTRHDEPPPAAEGTEA